MSGVTMKRLEYWSKGVAVVAGIVSVLGLVLGLFANARQHATDLRWQKARLARDLVSDMLNDTEAKNALLMIDWNNRLYLADGHPMRIRTAAAWDALCLANDELSDTTVFIRDSFDRLFYHLAGIERALRSDLVTLSDVQYPLEYYVDRLRPNRETATIYMRAFGYSEATSLFDRLPPQRPVDSTAARRCA